MSTPTQGLEPAYVEFVFRVHADGRRERTATVYAQDQVGVMRPVRGTLNGRSVGSPPARSPRSSTSARRATRRGEFRSISATSAQRAAGDSGASRRFFRSVDMGDPASCRHHGPARRPHVREGSVDTGSDWSPFIGLVGVRARDR